MHSIPFPSPMQFAVNALAIVGADLLQRDKAIPLEPIRKGPIGQFRSAIALQSAPHFSISALDLAHQLCQALTSQWEQVLSIEKGAGSTCATGTSRLLPITVWVQPPGWIFWQWSDGAIADWLATAADPEVESRSADPLIAAEALPFHLQYAHARCGALLQLAQVPSLTLHSPVQATGVLAQLHPCEQAILRAALCFSQQLQPTHHFIATISDTLTPWTDRSIIHWPPSTSLKQRVSEQWVQRFEQFYAACRINEAELSAAHRQVRAQAIAVMKRCLAILLTTLWDVDVPEQL
jgi:hypothetical protein